MNKNVLELFGPLHAHAFPAGAVLIYCHKSGTSEYRKMKLYWFLMLCLLKQCKIY